MWLPIPHEIDEPEPQTAKRGHVDDEHDIEDTYSKKIKINEGLEVDINTNNAGQSPHQSNAESDNPTNVFVEPLPISKKENTEISPTNTPVRRVSLREFMKQKKFASNIETIDEQGCDTRTHAIKSDDITSEPLTNEKSPVDRNENSTNFIPDAFSKTQIHENILGKGISDRIPVFENHSISTPAPIASIPQQKFNHFFESPHSIGFYRELDSRRPRSVGFSPPDQMYLEKLPGINSIDFRYPLSLGNSPIDIPRESPTSEPKRRHTYEISPQLLPPKLSSAPPRETAHQPFKQVMAPRLNYQSPSPRDGYMGGNHFEGTSRSYPTRYDHRELEEGPRYDTPREFAPYDEQGRFRRPPRYDPYPPRAREYVDPKYRIIPRPNTAERSLADRAAQNERYDDHRWRHEGSIGDDYGDGALDRYEDSRPIQREDEIYPLPNVNTRYDGPRDGPSRDPEGYHFEYRDRRGRGQYRPGPPYRGRGRGRGGPSY
jgi:hypothetical protein